MILGGAVIIGFLAAFLHAWIGRRSLRAPNLDLTGLVLVAFIPQWLAFMLPPTRGLISDSLAAVILVSSQSALLLFVWRNRHVPGAWLFGLGLILNLIVISINGGLMPIAPEMTARIYPDSPAVIAREGLRLGTGKDIVLSKEDTRLWWLSDRFFLLLWKGYRSAFSLGDVLIAVGVFWLLWSTGAGGQSAHSPVAPRNPRVWTTK